MPSAGNHQHLGTANEFVRLYTKEIEARHGIRVSKKEQEAFIRKASDISGYIEIDLASLYPDSEEEDNDTSNSSSNNVSEGDYGPVARRGHRQVQIEDDDEDAEGANEPAEGSRHRALDQYPDREDETSNALAISASIQTANIDAANNVIGSTDQGANEDPLEVPSFEEDDTDLVLQQAEAELTTADAEARRLERKHQALVDSLAVTESNFKEELDAARASVNTAKKAYGEAMKKKSAAEAEKVALVGKEYEKVAKAQSKIDVVNTLKRRRFSAYQASRRQRDRSDEGDVNLSGIGIEEKKWAVDVLLRFAQIAPHDAIALLRNICRTLTAKSKLWTESERVVVPTELNALDNAISLARASVRQQDIQHLLRCFHVAVLFRKASQKLLIGSESGEEAAKALVRKRKASSYHLIGMRIWPIAWSISPRNMFGMLLLPLFGLNGSSVMSIRISKVVALCTLFLTTNGDGCSKRLGIPSHYATVIDYIVERLIPAMELALIKNLELPGLRLPVELDKLIALQPQSIEGSSQQEGGLVGSDPMKFGLRISKDSPAQRVQVEVYMPDPRLLDSSYKTNTSATPMPNFIKYLDSRIRVNTERHLLLHAKHLIRREDVEGFRNYSDFWEIPLSTTPVTTDTYPGRTPRPSDESIPEHLWDALHPRIAYWGTFTSTEGTSYQPAFFGRLTEASLNIEKAQDSTLCGARKEICDQVWVEGNTELDGGVEESGGHAAIIAEGSANNESGTEDA